MALPCGHLCGKPVLPGAEGAAGGRGSCRRRDSPFRGGGAKQGSGESPAVPPARQPRPRGEGRREPPAQLPAPPPPPQAHPRYRERDGGEQKVSPTGNR